MGVNPPNNAHHLRGDFGVNIGTSPGGTAGWSDAYTGVSTTLSGNVTGGSTTSIGVALCPSPAFAANAAWVVDTSQTPNVGLGTVTSCTPAGSAGTLTFSSAAINNGVSGETIQFMQALPAAPIAKDPAGTNWALGSFLSLTPVAIASLPACPGSSGMFAVVNNGAAPTYLGVVGTTGAEMNLAGVLRQCKLEIPLRRSVMKRLLPLAFLAALLPAAAQAQQARVVTACGATAPFGALVAGGQSLLQVDLTGTLCSAGGGGGSFTWPGTAALTLFGIAPTGTVPAVNAFGFGRAATQEPTAVADGAPVAPMMTKSGRQVVAPYTLTEQVADGGGSSTTTAAIALLAASGSASLKEYLAGIQCTRSDAGTTSITVAVSEGTKTRTFVVPAGAGFGFSFIVPIAFAANTAVTATPSAGVTTLYCNAQGFYAP